MTARAQPALPEALNDSGAQPPSPRMPTSESTHGGGYGGASSLPSTQPNGSRQRTPGSLPRTPSSMPHTSSHGVYRPPEDDVSRSPSVSSLGAPLSANVQPAAIHGGPVRPRGQMAVRPLRSVGKFSLGVDPSKRVAYGPRMRRRRALHTPHTRVPRRCPTGHEEVPRGRVCWLLRAWRGGQAQCMAIPDAAAHTASRATHAPRRCLPTNVGAALGSIRTDDRSRTLATQGATHGTPRDPWDLTPPMGPQ